MKKKATKKQSNQKKEESIWLDIHNDAIMTEYGFRKPIMASRDCSVWTKTPREKKLLKMLRHSCKDDMHFNHKPIKLIPVRGNLIIYLKKNKKYSKPTYSLECWQHEIPFILSKYGESIIVKYSYNGITYAPKEIPFWI